MLNGNAIMHLGLNDAWNYHINYKNVKILISPIERAASLVWENV